MRKRIWLVVLIVALAFLFGCGKKTFSKPYDVPGQDFSLGRYKQSTRVDYEVKKSYQEEKKWLYVVKGDQRTKVLSFYAKGAEKNAWEILKSGVGQEKLSLGVTIKKANPAGFEEVKYFISDIEVSYPSEKYGDYTEIDISQKASIGG